MKQEIVLIGSGNMAIEYAKVLIALSKDFIVIGRGKKSASNFKKSIGKDVLTGGLENNREVLKNHTTFINCTNIECLASTTMLLLENNSKKILIEKPGSIFLNDLNNMKKIKEKAKSNVFIAYNRRYFSSIKKLESIVKKDGGIKSCLFEFTEISKKIHKLKKPIIVKNKWFLANSTHVIDLVFYLCGLPQNISSYYRKGKISWHPSASGFVGSGVTDNGVLFSYISNWDCPGRWSVEIITNKRRFILSPLEELKEKKDMGLIKDIKIDNKIDLKFKPGLYEMVKDFLSKKPKKLCDLQYQINSFKFFKKIANYY